MKMTITYKGVGILILGLAISLVSFLWQPTHASACTRTLWTGRYSGLDNTQSYAVCGRNMDWIFKDMQEDLWVFPRGLKRSSDNNIVPVNGMKWVSKYGSIITSVYDRANSGGINEKGLAVDALWLSKTNYGVRDEQRPGLDGYIALQYFLDNFATVKEVVDYLRQQNPQIVETKILVEEGLPPQEIKCHLAMQDANGESLIVEYINPDGKPNIFYSGEKEGYQGEYDVLTNDPTFEEQLKNLQQYEGFGGIQPLPATNDASARFVRATYYLKDLPEPENQQEAIAYILSVLRSSAQPFRHVSLTQMSQGEGLTVWRTVSDLKQKLYIYESTLYPTLIWIDAKKIDFSEGQPTRIFDLQNNREVVGEVSEQLIPTDKDLFSSM